MAVARTFRPRVGTARGSGSPKEACEEASIPSGWEAAREEDGGAGGWDAVQEEYGGAGG
jgi:hypothetical protein